MMNEKIRGIVLDVTRHSDRLSIVTLYTRSRGRLAFLSPVGSGKAGRLRQARLQPLAVIEADINFKMNAELQKLGAFALEEVWCDIYFNPLKSMVSIFLSEFMTRLLRATMPDETLWDYIVNSLRYFDKTTGGMADFHIVFLSSLLPFVGIQPDASDYERGDFFDMQSGRFICERPPHSDFLEGEEAAFVVKLCKLNFSNAAVMRLDRGLRQRILNGLLRYYDIHFPGTSVLRSLPVLTEIMS